MIIANISTENKTELQNRSTKQNCKTFNHINYSLVVLKRRYILEKHW